MTQFLYLVNGSEDGPIGIATSARKALEIAECYVKQAGGGAWLQSGDGAHQSMDEARKQLVRGGAWYLTITSIDPGFVSCHNSCTASIEKYQANYYHGLGS